MKCTCNAKDSIYITLSSFSSKSNTLLVILNEYVFSFQIFIRLLVINQFSDPKATLKTHSVIRA